MNQESVAVLMRAAAPVIAGFVAQEVAKATAPLIARIEELEENFVSLPPPQKGEKGDPGPAGADGAPGIDGKDGAPGIDGKDGRDGVDGKDGAPGADGKDGTNGIDGVAGKDGVGIAEALIDREGNLILTTEDGRALSMGRVVGKDGAPGPAGKDGRDGFSPEDFQAELKDDGRTLVLKLVRGENEIAREIVLPVVLDRGVWKEGSFQKGDGVTWGGSFFVAQCDTHEKPESESKHWRLAVKRGRDGKDGKDGPQGDRGPQGIPGKDWNGNRL